MSVLQPRLGADARWHPPALELDRSAPRPPVVQLDRPQLWAELDRAVEHPVALLSAPAGMGKTTGVAGWLGADDAAAVEDRTCWLRGGRIRAAEQLAPALTPTPADTSRRAVVVVDDADRLPPALLRLLQHRLAGNPDGLTVLLLSRQPLWPTGPPHRPYRLSAAALRFDPAESAELITRSLGRGQPSHDQPGHDQPEAAELIASLADGWPGCLAAMIDTVAVQSPHRITAADLLDSPAVEALVRDAVAALPEQQRHDLYCIAAEASVTATVATRLSGDPYAGRELRELAGGGFVRRYDQQTGDPGAETPDLGSEVTFGVHPAIAAVLQRHLEHGGAEVHRVRTSLVHAVRQDLARGRLESSPSRLLAAGEPALAVDLIATHGVAILLQGERLPTTPLIDRHLDAVIDQPGCWFAVALDRWRSGEVTAAAHWLSVITESGSRCRPSSAERAITRLMSSRIGSGSCRAAVENGSRLVEQVHDSTAPDPRDTAVLPLLLTELGIVQNWIGDLDGAESNLAAAAGLGHSRGWTALESEAKSHLAFTAHLRGQSHSSRQLASEVLAASTGDGYTTGRAALIVLLASFVEPTRQRPPADPPAPAAVHDADLSTRFWLRTARARAQMSRQLFAEAAQTMAEPLQLPIAGDLPKHLRIATLLETTLLHVLTGDGAALRELAPACHRLGHPGAAALVNAFRADLAADRRRAVDLFARAADQASPMDQSARAVALVCEAQLRDVLGEHETATAQLRTAISETAARRTIAPFLGWSRQGTPVHLLLQQLSGPDVAPWVHTLGSVIREDLTARLAPLILTPRERTGLQQPAATPRLSARQTEVLRELSRGSTYADIGANLFLSENTVKTHVAGLYAKLGVNTRSKALAVAREQHLL